MSCYLEDPPKLKNANGAQLTKVVDLAEKARGKDEDGYRAEFIRLVKLMQ